MVPQGWSWGGETEYERVWNRGRCMCACFLACLISRMCVFTSACMWLSRCACAWLSAMSVMYRMNVSAYLCVFLHLPISLWGHLLWTPASHLNFPSYSHVCPSSSFISKRTAWQKATQTTNTHWCLSNVMCAVNCRVCLQMDVVMCVFKHIRISFWQPIYLIQAVMFKLLVVWIRGWMAGLCVSLFTLFIWVMI